MIRHPATAYRTRDPFLIAEYHLHVLQVRELHEQMAQFADQVGGSSARAWGGKGSSVFIVGVVPEYVGQPPPVGMRERDGCWIPDEETATGRQLARHFERLGLDRCDLKGMPSYLERDGGKIQRRLEVFDGYLWATWSDDTTWAESDIGQPWERVPLSEYHVCVEASIEGGEIR